jgi:hypothetical protein
MIQTERIAEENMSKLSVKRLKNVSGKLNFEWSFIECTGPIKEPSWTNLMKMVEKMEIGEEKTIEI